MQSYLSLILSLAICSAYGQSVSSYSKNMGKIKEWNNPIYEIFYTNNSGKVQHFLPIAYKPDVRVNFEKKKLQPGESGLIKIQYYTDEFGKFKKVVKVYVSSEAKPIVFSFSGNIVSFHPDAFTVCPRIENNELFVGTAFNHNVRIIDAETKEPITDYEIAISSKRSSESLNSDKSKITLNREKPEWYDFEVQKENYLLARKSSYVSRNSEETVIELVKLDSEPENDFVFEKNTPEIDNSSKEDEMSTEKKNEPVFVDRGSNSRNEKISDEDYKDEEIEEEGVEEDGGEDFVFDRQKQDSKEDKGEKIVEVPKPNIDIDTETEKHKELARDKSSSNDEIITEVVDSPKDFNSDGTLNDYKYAFNHIVFLIDVSGSMKHESKLPLLKYSMHQMIDVLRPEDKVSIITYASEAIVLVDGVSGKNKDYIKSQVDLLQAKGQSYGKEALDMAYILAGSNLINDGNNEIILASDGVFNSKNLSERKLYRKASKARSTRDIRLSTIGFGKSRNALGFMQELADSGQGSFIQIKTKDEAETILIKNLKEHSLRF